MYQAIGSPRALDVFASAGGDALVKTWDTRSPQSTASFQAHQGEVLSLDWNKYEPQTIVSGGTDKMVKVWDLRALAKPVSVLAGHEFAVRRVKTSPHSPFILASASYDMTVRFWDSRTGAQVFVHNMHTEFSVGVDFSLFQPGRIATCGWDAIVDVMDVPQILPV